MNPLSTCWSVIRGAAAGNQNDQEEFARRYRPVIIAYLGARWSSGPWQALVEDALQEVFLECFRQGGVLDRVDPERHGGFRPFLFGVAQNVALRFEERQRKQLKREGCSLDDVDVEKICASEDTLSIAFDRAWAKSIVSEAASLHAARASAKDPGARQRVDLLRLRFFDGHPIRNIAKLWSTDAALLHREYAKARAEFRQALREVVAFDHKGPPESIDERCTELLDLLGRS